MAATPADSIYQTNQTTSQTIAKNFSNVTNGLLTACIRTNSARTINTVTWNGVSMTLKNTPASIGGSKFWVWTLPAPATGSSHNLVVTPDANAYCETILTLWQNADQSGNLDAINDTGGSGSSTSHSGSITTVTDNAISVMFHGDGNNSDATAGSNTTLAKAGHDVNTGSTAIFYSTAPVSPAGSSTLNCNFSAAGYNYMLFAIGPVAGTNYQQTESGTATVTDSVLKTPGKVQAEILTMTDAVVRGPAKVQADALAMTDAVATLKVQFKEVSDTSVMTDVVIHGPGKAILETVTTTDAVVRGPAKVVLDSTTNTDAVTTFRVLVRTIVDALSGLTDTVAFLSTLARTIIDALSMSDSVTARNRWLRRAKQSSTWTDRSKPA